MSYVDELYFHEVAEALQQEAQIVAGYPNKHEGNGADAEFQYRRCTDSSCWNHMFLVTIPYMLLYGLLVMVGRNI